MATFKTKAGENYEGLNIPTLPPGIYKNYKLTDVKKDKTTPSGGGEGTQILVFTFDGEQGMHQHTEYDIKADDAKAASKSDSMVKRIGHILRKFGVTQAVLDAMPEQASFDSYANWIMATLGQSHVGVLLDMKIVGNVYNSKANSGFPGYIPFVVKAGEPISFSNSELSQNKQFADFYASKPDTESTTEGTESRDTDF